MEQANIRRAAVAIGALLTALAGAPALAFAEGAPPPPGETSPYTAAPVARTAPVPEGPAAGVAIVALAGASDVAWPLAASVYAAPSMRPPGIDDAKARALCGEVPPPDAPADVRDLSQMVGAVTGDDAPSLALLRDVARRLASRAIVVVRAEADGPRARVFLADQGAFDAASYAPDGNAAPWSWSGATRSLVRAFGAAPAAASPPRPEVEPPPASSKAAPPLATHEAPKEERLKPNPFYLSGWFWGALGAAAFAGGAIFLATRDSSPSTIHLQIEVPH